MVGKAKTIKPKKTNYQNILVDIKNNVATITLNRPEVLNALNWALTDEMEAALNDAATNDDVRVVVIRGAGRSFCAGRDLKEKIHSGGRQFSLGSAKLWDIIESIPKPVIAAVHGYALTGGLLLAHCCDLVIASEDAKFGDTHCRWGLIPGGVQRLPRKIGAMRAKEMMFTADIISAREAERIGLITKVVPVGKLDKAVKELTDKILRNSSRSIAHAKNNINQGMEMDYATAVRMEVAATRWGLINDEPDADRERRLTNFREKRDKATK